ncbi:MAG TPA: pyridoxal-dependent decarboxylase [Pyrinomonadaceae bacterium]|nr:pyridoxal-dependent decarboxylase [Pyrinomonadaceae bacterium]
MALSQSGKQTTLRESSLDIDDESLRELSEGFVRVATDYFAKVADVRVFPNVTGQQLKERFDTPPPIEKETLEKILGDCGAVIDGSRHNGHPRFFGYVASPSTPAGAFADLVASALNASVTSWRSAPAPTEVERTVVRWLGSLIGFDEQTQGLLTSGGSMANLNALLIAHRAKADVPIARVGIRGTDVPMTIYASDQVHLSIIKAADILGLGQESVRLLPSDERFCLDTAALSSAIEQDRRQGLKPFCVIGSAGTAATGAIDSLADIAQIARENNLWFHIDGAYGAPAAMIEDRRSMFAGLDLADSISLDPHKWLYTPVDCGCLLFHDGATARKAFVTEADYIKVHELAEIESFAFWDYGIELSRRFRALKVWLTLKYYGAARLMEAIQDDIAMAYYMAERIQAERELELLAPVQLSICCFRYVPARLRAESRAADNVADRQRLNAQLNRLNERIMHRVQRGGRAYLSNAMLRGQFALRACIINFRTTRADIDLTLETVREAAREIEAEDESN